MFFVKTKLVKIRVIKMRRHGVNPDYENTRQTTQSDLTGNCTLKHLVITNHSKNLSF